MIRVSIVGGSGYTGGELLRLLLGHPEVTVAQVTSRTFAGKPLTRTHPHLRGVTELRYTAPDALEPCDLLFVALPHGEAARQWHHLEGLAPRTIDLSADFRLADPELYAVHYGAHPRPELLGTFAYGLAEVNRNALQGATRVSTGGCNATVSILALAPLVEAGVVAGGRTVVDVKVGSSEGGAQVNDGAHHPVRSGVVRPYKATGHRHTAEVESVLGALAPAGAEEGAGRVHLSVTAVEMVRGAAAAAHVFLTRPLTDRELWGIFRDRYDREPFVRLVNERTGPYRLPEPKLLAGTNFCDVGWERDPFSDRLVVVAALDNLVKGAAGQAVQAMNLMMGWEENAGLGFAGLHPV